MRSKLWMESIVRVINELGGYFTFTSGGEEYVVVRKSDFEALRGKDHEVQLELPEAEAVETPADQVLEKINRDIALYQLQQQPSEEDAPVEALGDEQEMDMLEEEMGEEGAGDRSPEPETLPIEPERTAEHEEASGSMPPSPPVRFEPLKGDLPPELQE